MEVTTSNDVLRVAMDAQMIRYMQVALTTVLVYNCVLSLDNEVKFIWKNRFSHISVIYLIFRYFGMAYMMYVGHIRTVFTFSELRITVGFPRLNSSRIPFPP
ncbi:hypothetical protein EDD17DRAFT_1675395, partial [Pisolithus thermaeus]